MIKLSILIATIPSRLETFYPRLIKHLQQQTLNRDDVEVVALYDNKKRKVGVKRNNLLSLAQGEYLTFIDDDDRVDDSYIQTIMDTLYANPQADCVVFDCITHVNGNYECLSKYGVEFEYGQTGDQWRGKPAHTMVWKSSIAKKHTYIDQNYGEDIDWVKRACSDIKNQVRIDKVLYYYDFDNNVSETRS